MRQHKTDTAKLKLILGATTLLLATTTVDAQKMYKVVGDDGSVSYQDKPPESNDASVEERHINGSNSRLSRTPPKAPVAQKQPDPQPALGVSDPATTQNGADTAIPAVAGQQPSQEMRQELENTLNRLPDQQNTPAAQIPQVRNETVQSEAGARDSDQTAAVPETRPEDPDGQPGAVSRASAQRNAQPSDAAKPEIQILESDDAKNADQQLNANSKSRNSRGRRPAPAKQQATEKRLTTEELAEIARSLEQ